MIGVYTYQVQDVFVLYLNDGAYQIKFSLNTKANQQKKLPQKRQLFQQSKRLYQYPEFCAAALFTSSSPLGIGQMY